jgi:prepilin-type processing-associated H-X9-DG protein
MVRCVRRPGFTLSQLLTLLAMFGILLGLFFPALVKLREAAARAQCQNNLKQIIIAMHNMNDTYNRLPPLAGPFPPPTVDHGTFFFHVLPFVEQDNVWKESADEAGIHSAWNNGIYGKDLYVPYYLCPADRTGTPDHRYQGWLATSNYAANFLVFGDPGSYSMNGSPRVPGSFPDGLSTTLAFAERYQICNREPNAWAYDTVSSWTPAFAFTSTGRPQIRPEPAQCDPSLPQSPHGTGSNAGMADGSVRHLSPSISAQTWWAACTPAGGEALGSDF